MKGLGNYRRLQTMERRVGTLIGYRGSKAIVRFHGGSTFALPADPLRKIGVEPNDRFVMIVVRQGNKVVTVKVEPAPAARPALSARQAPKIMTKAGRRVITRK